MTIEENIITLTKDNVRFDKNIDVSYFPMAETNIQARPSVVKCGNINLVVEGSGLAFKRITEEGYCTANNVSDEFDDDLDPDDFCSLTVLKKQVKNG